MNHQNYNQSYMITSLSKLKRLGINWILMLNAMLKITSLKTLYQINNQLMLMVIKPSQNIKSKQLMLF